jgi:hypothetical protein
MKGRLTLRTAASTTPRLKAPILILREIWYRAKIRERRIPGKEISCSSDVFWGGDAELAPATMNWLRITKTWWA